MCLWWVVQEGDSSVLVVRSIVMCLWWVVQENDRDVLVVRDTRG